LSSAFAILLGEAAARMIVNPADFLQAKLVDHPALGHRIEPRTTGHDALGFRNAETPQRADIIAIGDSMTYGVGAPREASWPSRLGALLGESVYNMGLGGYGPLQYLHLAKSEAVTLKPRLLVVAFYMGNDLMDAFLLARARPHWHSWRVSAEAEPSLTDYDRAGLKEPRKRFGALRDWLARNSVVYSMMRATVFQRFQAGEQDSLARQVEPDVRMLWKDASNASIRTIFTPGLRLAAVDLGLQSVREGMQISQKALAALKAEADRQEVRLLVVVIPTKERAHCPYLRNSGVHLPPKFASLCDAEESANAELTRFLRAQNIVHLDVTPALESHIERRVQVYPTDYDGHPQAAGYAVIAGEIAAAVRQHFPRDRAPRR
jgi:lysophospholipase L1-like esterase